MATYTDTVGFNKGSAVPSDKGITKVRLEEVELDFTAIAAARVAASLTAFATNDVLEVLHVPAKTQVLAVGADVTTANGVASTIHLGDGADPNGYKNAFNANAVGSTSTDQALVEGAPNTISGYSFGKYYSAADTIDLSMITAPQSASVIRVWAVMVDCS